ncbi:alpha/beta hydrolase [Deinococcus cellulosilyticus]|uniref:Transporter n=1 Tax=Deinococcus cellulosilyticus (strain DSM 18568 / NBRC 106333 / KACC 11606 / 5516J-15) TaxID=1223518 RepID=A0A511N9S4_DEIC1|nr:alpha/beta fold hydrolase [Deinococcus cellulosilyticus]GEM49583.1 transporter [Deinococcus cellulosilyticus NBRC 106333 = KACC 11606]
MNTSKQSRKSTSFQKRHFGVAVALTVAIAAASSQSKAAGFTEAPCAFGVELPAATDHTLSCGYVDVPAKHRGPAGKTYQLHVAWYKSTSANRKADPIITLNGGPGQKTSSYAPLANYLVAAIAPERDLIFFDQRGVGASKPSLDCPQILKKLQEIPLERVKDQTQVMATELNNCFTDLEKEGIDLGTFNTVESADDVAVLAKAVSAEKVNLYGASYGSRLAQEVMRRHPELLRSVVLDAVVTTDANYIQNREGTVDAALRKSLNRCLQDEACNAAFPNLTERLEKLADRLDQNPIKLPVPDLQTGEAQEVTVNAAMLGGGLMLGLYATQLVPVLPAIIDDIDRGNTQMLTLMLQSLQSATGMSSIGMQAAFGCNDLIPYARPEDLQPAEKPLKVVSASFGDVLTAYAKACEGHKWSPLSAETREVVKSDIPTLMFSGELDPVTPPQYAQKVLPGLSRAQFVSFPTGAHGEITMMPGACADGLVRAFLDDPASKLDAACAAVPHPFQLKLQ